ncbi:zinc finger (Ran-binding) family protein [Medicago truncatula]|uniref:Zinc finger (Ran-binding) family protein n=1 Tax=Medicago truncatula TaxID=3880 RepID=A0A072V277_MEDTR|nr:zinc finger (Ran-binding) family protein [Medicago truncatula]
MSRPGDWNCRTCNHLNFQRRESCQRCGESRMTSGCGAVDFGGSFLGGRGSSSPFPFTTGPDVRPGDWYCTVGNCGAHNFASRSSCFKCGAPKDIDTFSSDSSDMPRLLRSPYGFGAGSAGGGASTRPGWKSGDWICTRFHVNHFFHYTLQFLLISYILRDTFKNIVVGPKSIPQN